MEGFEMRPLSLDLRARIVAAYLAGEGSHETLGERFSVSRRVVGKLVQQYRELGTLEPQLHRRGRKPAITGDDLTALKKHVADFPDATAEERHDALGLKCTVKTVYETLHRLGYSFKKRHLVHPSKIDRMLPLSEASGVQCSGL